MSDSVVTFGPLRLSYDASDRSGEGYRTRDWYEEFISPIYADIDRLLEPKWIVDVGSNYGLTCLFARHRFPGAKIIAAEPAAHLVRYIRRNMEANGVANIEINHAIVGDQVRDSAAFHFHPTSTQDSRVISPGKAWLEEQTRETTLDALTSSIGDRDGVYIKIDTQGYEERVMRGGEAFLSRNRNWLIKTEFAPQWLISQGTDPVALLGYLANRYAVFQAPGRITFKNPTLASVLKDAILPDDAPAFADYVASLNRDRKGWVDLFIAPRELLARL